LDLARALVPRLEGKVQLEIRERRESLCRPGSFRQVEVQRLLASVLLRRAGARDVEIHRRLRGLLCRPGRFRKVEVQRRLVGAVGLGSF